MTHEAQPAPPVRRAFQIYLYAVCFVTVLVALFAAAESAYGLFRVISPDTTAATDLGRVSFSDGEEGGSFGRLELAGVARSAERRRGTAQFIQTGLIGAAAALIFRHHQRQATTLRAELESLAQAAAPPEPVVAAPAEPEPASPPTTRARRAPAKRKR